MSRVISECKKCEGRGEVRLLGTHLMIRCMTCDGTGRIAETRKPEQSKRERKEFVNNTSIKIPKKYHHMLDEVYEEIEDEQKTYWAKSAYGFCFDSTDSHVEYGETQKELIEKIRGLKACDCEECTG